MPVASPVYMTPPAVARRLAIKPERVIEFVRSGELAAVNVARRGCRRPRFRISPDALARFEAARSGASPVALPRQRRRAQQTSDYTPRY